MLRLRRNREGGAAPLERIVDGGRPAERALGDSEERDRLRAMVASIFAHLPTRARDIVQGLLLADEPATLEQNGEPRGVSKQRISQLEDDVKRRICVQNLDFASSDVDEEGPRVKRRAKRS